MKVEPMPFEKEIRRIIKARLPDTDMLNVMAVLAYEADQFQQAFDIALAMENHNLVKLLYTNINVGKVVVEFTLLGRNLTFKD